MNRLTLCKTPLEIFSIGLIFKVRRAAKIDTIQPSVVAVLRKMGIGVIVLNSKFDLALDYCNFHRLIEVKSGEKARLTESQKKLKKDGFTVERVNSVEDAIELAQWMRRMSAKLYELPRPDRQEAM